jgi:hypothetical protein
MEALKEYASLEFELCRLLMILLQSEPAVASAIFYQIANTRTRYAIIASLLDIRHKGTFDKAWPRLEKWLVPCDTARNHIIHWGQDERVLIIPEPMNAGAKEITGVDLVLKKLRIPILTNNVRKWRPSQKPPFADVYSEAELKDCERQFRAMKHIVSRYWNSIDQPEQWPWPHIFQQPIARQTPAEFLSRLNELGHPAQL